MRKIDYNSYRLYRLFFFDFTNKYSVMILDSENKEGIDDEAYC